MKLKSLVWALLFVSINARGELAAPPPIPNFMDAAMERVVHQDSVAQALRLLDEKYLKEFEMVVGGKKVPLRKAVANGPQGAPFVEMLLSIYVRGLESELAPPALKSVAEQALKLDPKRLALATGLDRALRNAATDPVIADVISEMDFIPASPPEFVMLRPVQFNRHKPVALSETFVESQIPAAKREKISFLAVRPQQIDMLRAIFQYSTASEDDKVLEIGYGTASVLAALSHYFPKRSFRGVDIIDIPKGVEGPLREMKIELFKGNAPKDEALRDTLKKGGPYGLIFAMDTISVDPHANFHPGVGPQEYVKWLYENLSEGGEVILLNDLSVFPPFTREQAKAAGFTVIRWGSPRTIGSKFKARMVHNTRDPRSGDLVVFVLRKGQPREVDLSVLMD